MTKQNEAKQEVSILDLSIDQLEEMIESNRFPDNVTWEGAQDSPIFNKLFIHRASPIEAAKVLLKAKAGTLAKPRTAAESEETKQKRLELKEQELEIKRVKAEKQTTLQKQTLSKLRTLEAQNKIIIHMLEELTERLTIDEE